MNCMVCELYLNKAVTKKNFQKAKQKQAKKKKKKKASKNSLAKGHCSLPMTLKSADNVHQGKDSASFTTWPLVPRTVLLIEGTG